MKKSELRKIIRGVIEEQDKQPYSTPACWDPCATNFQAPGVSEYNNPGFTMYGDCTGTPSTTSAVGATFVNVINNISPTPEWCQSQGYIMSQQIQNSSQIDTSCCNYNTPTDAAGSDVSMAGTNPVGPDKIAVQYTWYLDINGDGCGNYCDGTSAIPGYVVSLNQPSGYVGNHDCFTDTGMIPGSLTAIQGAEEAWVQDCIDDFEANPPGAPDGNTKPTTKTAERPSKKLRESFTNRLQKLANIKNKN